MKSQEQRIRDAANEYRRISHLFPHPESLASPAEIARRMLEAADREPPKWPTDHSLDELWSGEAWSEEDRDVLRRAMLADPIIQAAIRLRDIGRKECTLVDIVIARDAVVAAVIEAGL